MSDLVRVWIVSVDPPPEIAARCQDVLDDGERARVRALENPRDRQRFTVAHGALRILAGRELGTAPTGLTWTPGRHGKPEFSGLHTSLSHSGDMVAVAIAASGDRPVGVDIQNVLASLDTVALAARYFPADEAGYVAAGGDARGQAERFTGLWVRKEAVVKAAGSRLFPNLKIAVSGRDVVRCAEPAGSYRVADVAANVAATAGEAADVAGEAVAAGFRAAVALAGSAPFVVEAAGWGG
ncbi:MAG TPA: 4'-phosphopantetheinyl transferase superfamily protein [Streptosporangiaceae bacterium]